MSSRGTLLGGDHVPVAPVERFLAYLASIDRSPNTIRAYAHDLKDWFVFLSGRGVDWRSATLEDVGAFAGWLRLPPSGRDGQVAVLPSVPGHCGGSTVNRKLAALTSFCEFHALHGEPLAGLLVTSLPPGRPRVSTSTFRPFLHHITKSGPQRRRTVTVPAIVSASAVPRTRRCKTALGGHIMVLMDKIEDQQVRDWYASQDARHGWSRPVLEHHIKSDQTREILQVPYDLDFRALDPRHNERDLEEALVARLTHFLAELGSGFAFVGRQYKLSVGSSDYFIDRLFYHLGLRRFIVFELKQLQHNQNT